MADLLIIDTDADDLDWRGWEYDSAGAAAVWFERLVKRSDRLGKQRDSFDVGLWRSATPDRKHHFIIIGGVPGDVELLARAITYGTPFTVPEEQRSALWRSHVMRVLDEHARTGANDVTIRKRHHGSFLHSDGSMQPFPEPRGEG